MKLLIDQNLSSKLVDALVSEYPESAHVSSCGLSMADDAAVWSYAGAHGFAILTKDTDFHQRSFLHGAPPKVVWVRLGNCTTAEIEARLRAESARIRDFAHDQDAALFVLG